MGRIHPAWLIAGAFAALAIGMLAAWEINDTVSIFGDEQHYLIVADSVFTDRSFEVSEAYAREFAERSMGDFWPPAGTEPTELNTHALEGPNGLFSFHSPGLGILLAIPYAIGGVTGAKLAMIALASLMAPAGYAIARTMGAERQLAAGVVALVVLAAPFVPAATQIYPDLPAGVIVLAVLARLFIRRERTIADADAVLPFGRLDIAAMVALALAPWLHSRLGVIAVVLAVGWSLIERSRPAATPRWWLPVALLPASGLALMGYNLYAYDNAFGAVDQNTLGVSGQSLTVFFGLYLDQFHGLFVLNVAFIVALFALPAFVRSYRGLGLLVLATHLTFIVPNSLHHAWFGGTSFAGRFGWAAALTVAPIAIFGFIALHRYSQRVFVGVAVVVALVQARVLFRWAFGDFNRFNDINRFPSDYATEFPELRLYTPKFFEASWAFRYLPNLLGIVAVVAIITVGLFHARRRFPQMVTATLVVAAGAFVVAGHVEGYPREGFEEDGFRLIGVTGDRVDFVRIANAERDEPGVFAAGPYTELSPGVYDVTFEYSTSGVADGGVVGGWSGGVFNETPTSTGPLIATEGVLRTGGVLEIPDDADERRFVLALDWLGEGEITLHRYFVAQR